MADMVIINAVRITLIIENLLFFILAKWMAHYTFSFARNQSKPRR